MAVELRHVSGALGVEVRGVDLEHADETTVDTVTDARQKMRTPIATARAIALLT